MIPYILVIFSLFLIIIILFYTKNSNKPNLTQPEETILTGKPCPICHWPLQKNQRVHSIIYRSKTDIIMHIFGCPFCYKDHPKANYKAETERRCPACNKKMADSEFAIARLFEKPGKNHVHVLGCYRCRGKR